MIKRRYQVWSLLFLLLAMWSKIGEAQDPAYWQLTDEQGLPSRTVYDILQDSMGYIWMGTANGVSRFDGKTVLNISNSGLKDNEILDIEIDAFNHLWFVNLSGQLGCVVSGKVKFYDAELGGRKNIDFKILENFLFVKERKGSDKEKLYISKYEINQKGELVSSYHFKTLFYGFSSLFIFKEDGLLFTARTVEGGRLGLFELRDTSNSIKKLQDVSNRYSRLHHSDALGDLAYEWSENALYAGASNKLRKIYDFEIGNGLNNIDRIDGDYFLMMNKGAMLKVSEAELSKQEVILKNIPCTIFFEDREKNYWIGTTGNGVIVIPTPMLRTYSSKNSMLPNDEIYSLYATNDKLLVGQNGGHLSLIEGGEVISSQQLKTSGRITDLMQDHEAGYWIASDNNLLIADMDFNMIGSIRTSPKKVMQDSKLNIWLAYSNGLSKIKFSGITKAKQRAKLNENEAIIKSRTYAIGEDAQNRIWIGTSQGLYFYTDTLYPFLENGVHYNHSISDIKLADDDALWVSSLGDGVITIENQKISKRYNTSSGLSSNTCNKLFLINDEAWVASNLGLNIVNAASNEVRIVNKTDGLATNNINNVVVAGQDAWLGTSKGLVKFDRSTNTFNSTPPPVHITAVKIWNRDTSINEQLDLEHNQNNLQIEFVGLAFRARGDVTYKYKLDGVDQDWVHTNTELVRYPKIEPGAYAFQVYAINEDGVESEQPAVVVFEISKAWWNAWWFRIGMLLLIAMIVSRILQLRWRRLREKHEREQDFQKKVNELKQQALQTQMNPHFIFNSLNAIQQFVTTNDSEQAMQYLASFARLVRMIFEHSKRKSISFEEEIDFINLYLKLEKLRFKDRVETEIVIDDAIEQEAYQLQLPPLLLQPLIENAFKHGLFHKPGKGKLAILFSKEQNNLVCSITDDGVGRQSAKALNQWKGKEHNSSGIKTATERLAIINARDPNSVAKEDLQVIDLFDENNKASGTQIIVKINCLPK